jgi:hypothetical protein
VQAETASEAVSAERFEPTGDGAIGNRTPALCDIFEDFFSTEEIKPAQNDVPTILLSGWPGKSSGVLYFNLTKTLFFGNCRSI